MIFPLVGRGANARSSATPENAGKYVIAAIPFPLVTLDEPAPIAGLDKLFDQVAIMSAKSSKKEMAVLGPYAVVEYKAGNYVLLEKNPNYWRHDSRDASCPTFKRFASTSSRTATTKC